MLIRYLKKCFRRLNLGLFQLQNPSQHQWKMECVLGDLKFQTCWVLSQCYLNHNVNLVLQAAFLQLTLKSECVLPFLMEVLEGLSLAHVTGVQIKPWAGKTPATTIIIHLVSPASWIPRVNHCLVRTKQDVGICFLFSHLVMFGKVPPGWLRGCEHLLQMNLMLSYAYCEELPLLTLAFCRSVEWGKEINVNLESRIDWRGCICK